MRYTYLGDRLTDPALRGMQCDPVRRADGKRITRKLGTMLVIDAAGRKHNVLRRRKERGEPVVEVEDVLVFQKGRL